MTCRTPRSVKRISISIWIRVCGTSRRAKLLRQCQHSPDHADGTKDVSTDPVGENRAFEAAYTFYKAENYQNAATAFRDFLKNLPAIRA